MLITQTQPFAWNLTKSMLILWLMSILITTVAIFTSTFLSWPIAVVLTLVILLGHWGVQQLGDAIQPGIGAQVVTDFGLKDPAKSRAVQETVEKLSGFLIVISTVLPDISKFAAVEDIERGDFDSVGEAEGCAVRDAGVRAAAGAAVVRVSEEQRGGAMTTEAERTADSDMSKLPRMSETFAPPPPPVPEREEQEYEPTRGEIRRSRGRVGIVIVMVVSIALAGVASSWARRLRTGPADLAAGQSSQSSLANMNSFSLALLLGGLRGPLVMFLWTNSENLKNEKNLEDFDTYVEWIRLLQPEFDTVHIFQVWNKAYNISVQMAAVGNKYITILDALDYAKKVEASRPNNVSMIYQIGSIFYDKLGNSQEKDYYRSACREESKPHAAKQKLAKNDPGWRRLELDPVLDDKGMLLPATLRPRTQRPATLPANANGQWVNGAELQFLEPYQPFPYGVSTMAFGYNYHKQAQVLQMLGRQMHANLSETVVDSRPALALKAWSEDEWERGRRLELKALNAVAPGPERGMLELPTASVTVAAPLTDKAALSEAIFSYDLAARLSRDAYEDYFRHIREYAQNYQTYQSHMDSMRGQEPLLAADRDYLKAMIAPDDADAQAAARRRRGELPRGGEGERRHHLPLLHPRPDRRAGPPQGLLPRRRRPQARERRPQGADRRADAGGLPERDEPHRPAAIRPGRRGSRRVSTLRRPLDAASQNDWAVSFPGRFLP